MSILPDHEKPVERRSCDDYPSESFHPPRCDIDEDTGAGGLMKTMSAVANGPRKSEMRNQTNRERFFCSASPALIKAKANQKAPPSGVGVLLTVSEYVVVIPE